MTMTDEQAMELGRRAVAPRGFRWCAGMLTMDRDRVLAVGRSGDGGWFLDMGDGSGLTDRLDGHEGSWWRTGYDESQERSWAREGKEPIPDLRDPCTVVGLLWLVREAHGDPRLSIIGTRQGWSAVVETDGRLAGKPISALASPLGCATEAEALVAALGGAP